MSDRCPECGKPSITAPCKDCGFCTACAAGTIDEGEGLCETCIFRVAVWAIYRVRYLEKLVVDASESW